MKPALGAVYMKTAGKMQMWGKIQINTAVQQELTWFVEHVRSSDGIFFFDSMVWCDDDHTHSTLTIYVDASSHVIGIWFLLEKMGYQCPLPPGTPTDAIFFFKALAICCTVHLTSSFPHATRLHIVTDNTNTFDIFGSLSALPSYNSILISTVDVLLRTNIDLCVIHIPGTQNVIADALSQYHNELATKLVDGLTICTFQPPRNALGVIKK